MPGILGRYFDGETAARHDVEIVLDRVAGVLTFSGASVGDVRRWPTARLRALSDQAPENAMTVTLLDCADDGNQHDVARLIFSDPDLVRELERLCPDLHRKDVGKGVWRKVALFSFSAIAALALVVFVILPRMADILAELIPVESEIALGKEVVSRMEWAFDTLDGGEGELVCESESGRKALDKMLERLTAKRDLKFEPNIKIFDNPMVNAFAAPGGQIVLMRGLLDSASGPDAVASVLAHEIGHSERRDGTRNAIRAAGSAGLLSMVLGDVTGGTLTVFMAEALLNASYSREAEAAADEFALEMLNDAGISSVGMAEFFEFLELDRDAGEEESDAPEILEYFASHPAAAERASLARKNADESRATEPALNEADWNALLSICYG